MEERVFNYIKEQIEFLKADLNRDVPLNMESPYQPDAAARIAEGRTAIRQQILQLLNRLTEAEAPANEKLQYRLMLERIALDKSGIEMVKDAVAEMVDEDCKQEVIDRAVEHYEESKRIIAEKIIALVG